ncbi:MAG: muconate cycloisomerase family protein [Candidatus Binataceae bacterium]
MTRLKIRAVRADILDLPIRRPHTFASLTITKQSYLLVRLQTEEGIEGVGEGVTAGDPWWGGESVEGMKSMIDSYLAPLLIGEDATRFGLLRRKMNTVAAGNPSAKAALEMALLDAWAKALEVPLHELLGGIYRDSIPTTWALATADVAKDCEEAQRKRETHGITRFKVKIGAAEPERDVARIAETVRVLGPRASVRIDLNQAWDELTATRWLPELESRGLDLVEQPIQRWNLDGMARLAAMLRIPILADESLYTIQDALEIVRRAAADIFALKIPKSGGLFEVKKIAAIAEAAGLPCYGGSTLETSIGTAASIHLYCSIPNLTAGCELFGPLWLADDIVEESVAIRDGQVWLPQGRGIGVRLDEQKVRRYLRA